jgi:hypothetical protein
MLTSNLLEILSLQRRGSLPYPSLRHRSDSSHPYRILYLIGFTGTSATRRARRLGVQSE